MKGRPDPGLYQVRKEALKLLEEQSENGNIDLLYGDETRFSEQGYVPYAWQFDDEDVSVPACRGRSLNCFGLLSRGCRFVWRTTEKAVDADFVIEVLDQLSFSIPKLTVVVLDNARIHTARKFKELIQAWQRRGLFIFYLPPYSPHLNIIERLWKEIKEGWIRPADYETADSLFYAVNRTCSAIGTSLFVNFSTFNL